MMVFIRRYVMGRLRLFENLARVKYFICFKIVSTMNGINSYLCTTVLGPTPITCFACPVLITCIHTCIMCIVKIYVHCIDVYKWMLCLDKRSYLAV